MPEWGRARGEMGESKMTPIGGMIGRHCSAGILRLPKTQKESEANEADLDFQDGRFFCSIDLIM